MVEIGTLVTDLSVLDWLARFSASPSGAITCAEGNSDDQAERKM